MRLLKTSRGTPEAGVTWDSMAETNGPFHRVGQSTAPGARCTALDIEAKMPDGSVIPGRLLDAGVDVTEVELLRTVARMIGVKWGRDELGWWAVVLRQ